MRYRIAELLAEEDLGASGTKTIDITGKDIISRLEIKYGMLNGDWTIANHPAANITRLELVDGSDILFSLTGKCAQAMDYYNNGKEVYNNITLQNGAYMECLVAINFGRYLWDPDLAFDPTKFTNPQLKISFNRALANTACVTSSCKVDSFIFDEFVPTPAGFLMTKEHYTYSPDANAYEQVELPTDYVLRRLALQCLTLGTDCGNLIREFKISEDNNKRIPFDTTWMEEMRRAIRTYNYYSEVFQTYVEPNPVNFYVTPGSDAFVIATTTDQATTVGAWSGGGGIVALTAEAGTPNIKGLVRGLFPHSVFDFPFGKQDLIEDWYNVTGIGSLRFRIRAGASASATDTFRVLTQQHRTY